MNITTKGLYRVKCTGCGHDTQRKRREDGTFGVCRCGAPTLVHMQMLSDKRMAKAKLELAAYDAAVGGAR